MYNLTFPLGPLSHKTDNKSLQQAHSLVSLNPGSSIYALLPGCTYSNGLLPVGLESEIPKLQILDLFNVL